jgi:hypothetical protein
MINSTLAPFCKERPMTFIGSVAEPEPEMLEQQLCAEAGAKKLGPAPKKLNFSY